MINIMVFKFNEYNLDLGDVDIEKGNFSMKGESSYVEALVKRYKTKKHYREVMLPLKIQCLLNIKGLIKDGYKSYLDLLAGIGISSKIFHKGDSCLNDFAPDCVEILKRNFCYVENTDMFDYPKSDPDSKFDFIFLDFNNFTIKKYLSLYKPVVDAAFARANTYVLINDCSVFFLKYGKKSFEIYSELLGIEIKSKDDYIWALQGYFAKIYPEWRLCWVEGHKETNFLLFQKTDCPNMTVSINKKEDIKVKTSLE